MNDEQRAVLAHVVEDPDEWYANAIATYGEPRAAEMLTAKVERWRASYVAASTEPGYLPRAQRADQEPAATVGTMVVAHDRS